MKEKGNNLKEKQLLRKLQNLQKKARINAKGVFGWHIGRKLFMRTCAELGITSWNAKLMVGKAVDKSTATYINGLALKNDAVKVSNALRMEVSNGNGKVVKLETLVIELERENKTLKDRIEILQKHFYSHELLINEANERILALEKHTNLKRPFVFGKREIEMTHEQTRLSALSERK
jgi:hypothetical protein